jgi:hypothetical protein
LKKLVSPSFVQLGYDWVSKGHVRPPLTLHLTVEFFYTACALMENATASIRAQIPVSLVPSQVEIVYSPDSQGYSLNFGITVQLPINDLVESLLKFNATHHSVSACEGQVCANESTEDFLQPEPDIFLDNFAGDSASVLPLIDPEDELPPMSIEDTFNNIPISLIRQDEAYLDYLQRSKWQYSEATFFTRNPHKFNQEKALLQERQLRYLQRFLEESTTRKHRTSSSATSAGSSVRLSADAPVFTPGSSGVSFAADGAGSRARAWSESPPSEPSPPFARERAMTTAESWAPPAAEDGGCSQM